MPGITLKQVKDVMDKTQVEYSKAEQALKKAGGDEAKALRVLSGEDIEEDAANAEDAKDAKTEASKSEVSKTEDVKAEDTKAEKTSHKESKGEEAKTKKVKVKESEAEEAKTEPAGADELKASKAESKTEDSKAEAPKAESKAEATKAEAPKADAKTAGTQTGNATAEEPKADAQRDNKKHADDLVEKLKEIVKKGNVVRIEVKHKDQILLSIPINVGIVGSMIGIAAAPWAILAAAIAAYGFSCKVHIINKDGSKEDVE